MLTPYIPSSAAPLGGGGSIDWARPIFKLCAASHIDAIEGLSMEPSETLLLQAVEATTKEICCVVTSMWASGVVSGFADFLNPRNEGPSVEVVMDQRVNGRPTLIVYWIGMYGSGVDQDVVLR
ncbi:hypothetical protein BKA82DRAFT_1008685 [Pisolithus tinctorius]|uniref:Uncharacterized protein n=1 Tax=Pisolithus tinctorius Marx 270 TaxID=870435 RepID=A0A0C3NDP1_PISTI|nr:hypothetical protein BKA82DRAFT_1008685 [Pisolithus tinctorius]KIN93885.1 hypothetical protein M404DRAFT_1008685 [Pisolithus tinctorius Marx 270]